MTLNVSAVFAQSVNTCTNKGHSQKLYTNPHVFKQNIGGFLIEFYIFGFVVVFKGFMM